MVFMGPQGTGKTTVASKFGKLLKDLNILPSDHITSVTGTSAAGPVCWRDKGKGPQGNASGSRWHLVHRRGLRYGRRDSTGKVS
eukprot:30437_6